MTATGTGRRGIRRSAVNRGLTAAFIFALDAALAGPAPWRTYDVYQPTITRHTVVDGDVDELNYNHGSTIAWFRGQWFCLWNANQIRCESKPGQIIYWSRSTDGRTWSAAEPAFTSPEHSANPVPCSKDVQWQPNLIVVGDELWAAWSQLSKDDHYGCYLSRLSDARGKWRNRRLLWDGRPNPEVDGKSWRVLPLAGPTRLRTGRILVPVTLLGRRASDAPDEVKSWHGLEKRSSVLYSDDLGETWGVSPGAVQPGRSWAQWEPTVWELRDGSVMMFARNSAGGKRPQDALLQSMSTDAGATWTPHRRVPLCTAISRMHVAKGAGNRFVMAHNDWPSCPLMGRRYNLALFFGRGAGVNFVAGPGYSGIEPVVAYPCLCIHGDRAVVSYSAGHPPRAIKVAHISPLPSPDRYYLFPRTNIRPPAAPIDVGTFLRFAGHHYLVSRRPLSPNEDGFSAGAWVMSTGMTLLDTRRADPAGGFVWGMKGTRPFLCMFTPEHEMSPSLRLQWHEWQYFGLTVDNREGEVTFYVGDRSETLRFTAPAPLLGASAHVGAKSLPASRLRGLDGVLRSLAMYPSVLLDRAEHNWLRNQFAASIGQPLASPSRKPSVAPALWLDPSDPMALSRDFRLPPTVPRGVEVSTANGEEVLRFTGECSAGLDLDETHRGRDDRVELTFRFGVEAGDRHVLCTVGDADAPARVVATSDGVWLTAKEQERPAGSITKGGWTTLVISTNGSETQARVGNGPPVSVRHNPMSTWVYLGEGYPPSGVPDGARFIVSVRSVRSRVTAGTEG